MTPAAQTPRSGFVTAARRVYRPLGFMKGYNFALFFIFSSAMTGFCLARLHFFDFHGVFCSEDGGGTLPGECYWYLKKMTYQVGIRLHLMAILPAGILACFQFVPVFRQKWMIFHRLNGYLVVLLALAGNAGALMIARHAVGGTVETQTAVGLLFILTTGSLGLAWYNIKRLQIDQHRAWMLRAWFYFGTIITARIILLISALIISKSDDYYHARPCAQVNFMLQSSQKTLSYYPDCAPYFDGSNPNQYALVRARFSNRVEQIAASFGATFGMAVWLGMAIQAIGVEVYLNLTPKEAGRLRQVSYQRQLEAGYSNAGNAGLTAQRLGDADPCVPVHNADGASPEG